jgi:hypothetical protein
VLRAIEAVGRIELVERQHLAVGDGLSPIDKHVAYRAIYRMVDERAQWVPRRPHLRRREIDKNKDRLLFWRSPAEIVAHLELGAADCRGVVRQGANVGARRGSGTILSAPLRGGSRRAFRTASAKEAGLNGFMISGSLPSSNSNLSA